MTQTMTPKQTKTDPARLAYLKRRYQERKAARERGQVQSEYIPGTEYHVKYTECKRDDRVGVHGIGPFNPGTQVQHIIGPFSDSDAEFQVFRLMQIPTVIPGSIVVIGGEDDRSELDGASSLLLASEVLGGE